MTNVKVYGLQNEANCIKSAELENAYCKALSILSNALVGLDPEGNLINPSTSNPGESYINETALRKQFDNHYTCPSFYYETKELGTECSTPGTKPQSSFEFEGETVTVCAGIIKDATTGGHGNYMDVCM